MSGASQIPAPAQEESNPYLPPGPPPLVFEDFAGINTEASRPAIGDDQMAWSDGWMPIGKSNLRVLPDVGSAAYSVASGGIAWFDFGNIGSIPYAFVVLTTGALVAVNLSTTPGVATTLLAAGTINTPSLGNVGLSQWGAQYIVFVANQGNNNGYWVYDGTLIYGPGTLAPGVTVTAGGSGYTSAPTVTASGGAGSGATFSATISGGVVVTVSITNPGSGYNAGDTVTLAFSGGGGSGATATVNLMPFGISGTAVETYQGRVWVARGGGLSFSAPGTVWDFATSDGGGNFTSTDSFLRVTFVSLQQTNGFLYLIADSSINYISQVSTSGSPPTTTFSNQNANPEVGTPWSDTVDVFSENIVFANSFGAHVSYGGKVTKISEALDGLFNTALGYGGFIPSAAKAIIFGKRVWMVLQSVYDPVQLANVNKLLMWNGKFWWTSQQGINLVFIQTQEINSVLTAWGTDGTGLYPLFQEPTSNFTRTAQSKLWAKPGGVGLMKSVSRLWGIFNNNTGSAANVTISIDSENGSSEVSIGLPGTTGIYVLPPQAVAQNGVLTGISISTTAPDISLISLSVPPEIEGYRG